MKNVLFSGSRPAPIQSATLSKVFATISLGVGVMRGQRVPVDDAVERVVLRLQRDPVLQGADQVAEMKFSGRAHPRQHALLRHWHSATEYLRQHNPRPDRATCSGRRSASKHTESGSRTGAAARPCARRPAGSTPSSTLPPSSGGTGIMLNTASSTLMIDERTEQLDAAAASRRRRRCRPGRRAAHDRTARRRRSPPSRGCWPARRRRSARNRASGVSGCRVSTGTGLAQPISGTPVSNAISGNTSVPIGSTCTAGLSDSRPSCRAVGSPSRSAAHACAASCTDSDAIRTTRTMRTSVRSMLCTQNRTRKGITRLTPSRAATRRIDVEQPVGIRGPRPEIDDAGAQREAAADDGVRQ